MLRSLTGVTSVGYNTGSAPLNSPVLRSPTGVTSAGSSPDAALLNPSVLQSPTEVTSVGSPVNPYTLTPSVLRSPTADDSSDYDSSSNNSGRERERPELEEERVRKGGVRASRGESSLVAPRAPVSSVSDEFMTGKKRRTDVKVARSTVASGDVEREREVLRRKNPPLPENRGGGGAYNKILNPATENFVDITSRVGQQLLNNYINVLNN